MRWPAVLLPLMLMVSCGHLQDVALYDVVQPEVDPWAAFEYAEIFTDSERTQVFGLKEVPCRSFRAVREGSHSGEDHLHLRWDQSEGCNYIGMGFLWKDYKGKDLTGVYEEGAIELMVRVDSGFLTKVPMFFSLAACLRNCWTLFRSLANRRSSAASASSSACRAAVNGS